MCSTTGERELIIAPEVMERKQKNWMRLPLFYWYGEERTSFYDAHKKNSGKKENREDGGFDGMAAVSIADCT